MWNPPPGAAFFCFRLQYLRYDAGVTQPQLAKRLGVRRHMVGEWERMISEPRFKHIRPMADLLGVHPGYLAFGRRASIGSTEPMGIRLRRARIDRGLTMLELGRAIGKESHGAVDNYERGSAPRLVEIEHLANVLRIPPEWLAFGEEKRERLSTRIGTTSPRSSSLV